MFSDCSLDIPLAFMDGNIHEHLTFLRCEYFIGGPEASRPRLTANRLDEAQLARNRQYDLHRLRHEVACLLIFLFSANAIFNRK